MMAVKTRNRLSWAVVGVVAVMIVVLASLLSDDTDAGSTTTMINQTDK